MELSQIEYFKQILIEKRKETQKERDRLWENIRQAYDVDNDDLHHSDDLSENSVTLDLNVNNFKLLEREDRYLQKLDEALEMIKFGEYGICRVCGQDINLERLKAVPTTSICVSCKNVVSHTKRIDEG